MEMPVPLDREGLEFLFKYPPEARKEELERCSKEYLLQFIELARGEWARLLEHIAGGCKGQLYKPLAFGGASEQMRRVDDSLTDGFTQHYLDIYAGSDGAGGAPHLYQVVKKNALDGEGPLLTIQLQHGNPEEVGVNGVGTETLLFIGLDFLTKCLAGPYASAETAQIVSHLRQAFEWVKKREEDRKARGVYQKHQA